MAATAEQINATIDAYVAAFSAGDRGGYLALWAPDATVEDPVGSDVAVGADGIAAFWDGVRALASDIELQRTGDARVAAGEAAWPLRAITAIGDMTLSVDIIDVMAFDDEGRITSLRAFWDPANMAPYEG
jgi:steroid delta-isomerase